MALPAFATALVKSWAVFYDAHHAVSVTVRFLHLAALVVGGGGALAADGRVLRALRASADERKAILEGLRGVHRVVVPALAVMVASGLLLMAADAGTFLVSPMFWRKMAFFALLLINGGALVRAESAAEKSQGSKWGWLALTSAASLILWLVILYLGLFLTVAA